MPQNHNFLALIVRHLNNPSNSEVKAEVEKLRLQSRENDAYFNQIKEAWLLSEKAKVLDTVKADDAVKRLKQALNKNVKAGNFNWIWLRNVAAILTVTFAGYWLYQKSTSPVWLTKTTTTAKLDSVKLSDGSLIVLAPNSEIRYPEKFKAGDRNIFFSKGQAFFRIAKDTLRPFKITINQSDVTVLGTSFNIQLSSASIDLSVKTGKVMFLPYQGGVAAVLTAGQAINYNLGDKQFTTNTSQNADAWLTHELVFEDTPLDVVCQQLTEYYKIPVKLANHHKTIKELNATFTNNTLNEVLEILSETYDIKVVKQAHQIILTNN